MTYDVIKQVQSTKFLGIHYDEHLTFKTHINYLAGKLSKLAGMFYSLSDILPTRILKTIYNTHVNSLLSYNTPIWCCNYKTNVTPIHLLQKRIIRNVTKSDFLAHSRPLFKTTKTLTVYDLNKLYMGSQFFKFPSKYILPLQRNHNQNTRFSQTLLPLQHRLSLVRNSFLIQGPLNYNKIPNQIKQSRTLTTFKKLLKKYLLAQY